MRVRLTALVLALALGGCAKDLSTHGNIIEQGHAQLLQTGVTTQDDTVRLLGTPTVIAPFDHNVWYYINEQTRREPAKFDKLVGRTILVLTYNKDGKLEKIDHLNAKNGKQITMNDQKTPSQGQPPSILGQMLGNFGHWGQ